MADDRDRPTHLPPAELHDGEGAGPELTLDRELATSSHAIPSRHGQLHGFPLRELEAANRGDAEIGPEGLDAARVADPSPAEIHVAASAARRASAGRRAGEDRPARDLAILDKGLGLDLRGRPRTRRRPRARRDVSAATPPFAPTTPARCSRARRDAHAGTPPRPPVRGTWPVRRTPATPASRCPAGRNSTTPRAAWARSAWARST